MAAQPASRQADTEKEAPAPLEIHSLADLKRAIRPGAELMATYHAYHPEIVGLVRVVTKVQTNAFYSVIKDQPDHKYSTCNYGDGFRSEFEKASSYQFEGTAIKVLNSRKGDGSILYEFEMYAPKMEMEAREKNSQETRDPYLSELRLQLLRAGFEVGEIKNGSVDVLWAGAVLCQAMDSGAIHYHSPDVADGRSDAFHKVLDVTRTVSEYMRQLETAPPLVCTGLRDGFKLLAEFNGTVFAGRKYGSIPGHQFVTWSRTYDGTGVTQGHYIDDYETAKKDFAERSGLVQKGRQFSDEQLAEIYRCIHETLDSGYPITPEREKLLTEAAGQIDKAVPDLEQRVDQSNQLELEYAERYGHFPELG